MSYVLVPGARNTMVPGAVLRAVPRARRRWGVRGLGQVCETYDDDTGECTSYATDSSGVYLEAAPVSCPAGYTQNPDGSCSPASLAVVASGPALPPGSISTSTGTVVNNPSAIGTSGGCPSGYVVGNAYGGCVPSATLASTLSSSAGASTLGLTAAQAQAVVAALNAGTTIAKIATGQPVGTVPVAAASANPFANLSSSTLLIGGAVVFGSLLILMGKKR